LVFVSLEIIPAVNGCQRNAIVIRGPKTVFAALVDVPRQGKSTFVRLDSLPQKMRTLREHCGNADMSAKPQLGSPVDPYDAACDQAIATCGGDMRGTIKALLCANEFLEADLSKARVAASKGYIRQGLAKRKVIVHAQQGRLSMRIVVGL
jgi:hypothetical protein